VAQTPHPVAKLNELTSGIDIATLTTIRADGTLHSCPMAVHAAEPDGAIWFLTGANTEKVEAVRSDHHVNLAYSDPATQRYVSVTGNCELVRDHVKAKELWRPHYNEWFPNGLNDPNLILLKIYVQDVEYWQGAESRMLRLTGFGPPPIAATI